MNLYYFLLSFGSVTICLIFVGILFDYVGIRLFVKADIEGGLTVLQCSIDISGKKIKRINGVHLRNEGKFNFLTTDFCIFTSRHHLFSFPRLRTLFSVNGLIEIDNSEIKIKGKIPIVSVIICAILVMSSFAMFLKSVQLGLLSTILVSANILASFYISKSRYEKIISEFKILIGLC